ncbi:TetR/AcrR family transcriptional regulator [Shimazuella kribbensis]|uniref:TetR/AcrR family transcriptional regulator n=1 Tax=Shimazuella kribbensis TaxID=139808 RepID=UPI0003F63DA5|nr:TetR/AcrR family transcriptional regulator [Shimazuella kribbensis]
MPKIVNHELRRKKVAEAAWRVIQKDGLEKASVRNIAQEASMSLGAMRHYFKTQSELFLFCMQMVIDRASSRIQSLTLPDDTEEAVQLIIEQVLPLDDDRRAESEVWLAFISKSFVDPDLHRLRQESHELLHQMFRNLIDALVKQGIACPDVDPELETLHLHALVDGFAVHGVTQQKKIPAKDIKKVIQHHIKSLIPIKGS